LNTVRVGCGAANEPDTPRLALDMLLKGNVSYLAFDNLAERSLALAQMRKAADPREGYATLTRKRMGPLLGPAKEKGVRLTGNFGSANVARAAEILHEEAAARGMPSLRVAAVTGDDVLEMVLANELPLTFFETGGGLDSLPGRVVSANVYLGAAPIVDGLEAGADVVVTGRCADISPYIASIVHAFGWSLEDYPRIAGAGIIGHLLECGRYVTGGSHADPFYGKEVPSLDDLAFPLVDAREDGTGVISKTPGTGGMVTVATCREQLLYEVHDPGRYLSPDATLDFTQVKLQQVGRDQVEVTGARGGPPPDTYKVVVGIDRGWVGEGEISFSGPGCIEKAEMCADIARRSVEREGIELDAFHSDIIGVNSMPHPANTEIGTPPEVRVRMLGRAKTKGDAEALQTICEGMWFGPTGGGGNRTLVRQAVGVYSALIPRDRVPVRVQITERTDREVMYS
jgi:hypothetical protein